MRLKMGIVTTLTVITLALCPITSAYANTYVAAAGFIDAMAAAAGLSTSEFIATSAGIISVGTGLTVANDTGIKMGNTASENLSNLIDAANYPDWDTLSASEKANYENDSTNYDAAKYNSLMSAFGMADASNRYYGYTGSGGANWEADWTETELEKLQEIGTIGSNWLNGASNKVDDVIATITNRNIIENYFPPQYYSISKTEEDADWPSNVPDTINYQVVNSFTVKRDKYTLYGKSNIPVPTILFRSEGKSRCFWVNETQFGAGIYDKTTSQPSSSSAEIKSYNGKSFYYKMYSSDWYYATLQWNDVSDAYNFNSDYVLYKVLFGEPASHGGEQEVPDYPDDISLEGDTNTYYPDDGVQKNTNWMAFITQPATDPENPDPGDPENPGTGDPDNPSGSDLSTIEELLRQFQFYTTGQLKVHDEGVFNSITEIGTALDGIETTLNQILAKIGLSPDAPDVIGGFDFPELQTKTDDLVEDISSLAPFGSMLLMSEMVAIVSQVGVIEKPELVVPFNFFAGHEYNVIIDLSWMDPLKPVINALMIIVLVMTLAGVSLRFVELEASS